MDRGYPDLRRFSVVRSFKIPGILGLCGFARDWQMAPSAHPPAPGLLKRAALITPKQM